MQLSAGLSTLDADVVVCRRRFACRMMTMAFFHSSSAKFVPEVHKNLQFHSIRSPLGSAARSDIARCELKVWISGQDRASRVH
eukprot:COSAG06_NODE_367_length_16758_cov_27.111651_6_plen_83_part_00